MKTEEQKLKKNTAQKEYAKEHPEKTKAFTERWKKANPEKVKATIRKWYKKNPEKVAAYEIARNYKKLGFSHKEYLALDKKQKGVCAICKKKDKSKKLSVDHCHTKLKVRGLLCSTCNIGLGMFNNISLLKKAISYLNKKQ
jgi:hypothetical protein